MRWTSAAVGIAVAASGVLVSSAAQAAGDSWESQSGIYHYFTVPKASVPSNACGNSTGAGSELEGNIGPAHTWAAVGLDASGQNCVADIGPMEPGLYYYRYVATMADRSKQVFRNPSRPVDVTSHPDWNTLFVPGPAVDWMDDVESGGGEVASLTYTSSVAQAERTVSVWTPPGYDATRASAYPVLYLLSGDTQSYLEWQELGRAKQILDNLAVDGDLASMVVVMADPGTADYRSEVIDNILPAVESDYNVSHDGSERAIAGIGSGGSAALGLTLSDPGVFGSVGSMSASLTSSTISASTATAVNNGTDLIRLYVGNTLDPEYNATYDALTELRSSGVDVEFDGVTPGTGGVWDTWRENLRDFASRIFQPTVADHGMSEGHRDLTEPYTPPATGSITTPFIDENGMVTFETGTQWADAKDVVLWGDWAPNGQWFRIPLTKVGDRWRTTIGPIDGYYYWRYEVDGTGFHDPADTTNVENVESQLFVPGGTRTPLLADVPADEAGTITQLSYTSAYSGTPTMKLKVWTPPDYDPNRAEKYPVLYLYHGFNQNYASWTEVGRAKQILDNLYADGKLVPMVVVMPGFPGTEDFYNDLWSKVMPLATSTFNISTEQSKMALAGLSWGARGTQGTMVNHPGIFSWYGIFSPPFASGSLNATSGQAAKAGTRLVSMFAGDIDSGAVSTINSMEANFATYGLPTRKSIIPGPHGFDVWWTALSDFLPRIFDRSAGISISQEAADFGRLATGYGTPASRTLTVVNAQNAPTADLTVTLQGADADKFTLSTTSLGALRGGRSASVTVTPNPGLPEGSYQAAVVVDGGSAHASVPARVEVAKAYPVTVTASGDGSVDGAGSYFPGDTVTLSAVPASGQVWTGWSSAVLGWSSSLQSTFTMPSSPVTVTATFRPVSLDALQSVVTSAEQLAAHSDGYTPESWAALRSAIAAAHVVLASGTATTAQASAATAAIQAALNGLVPVSQHAAAVVAVKVSQSSARVVKGSRLSVHAGVYGANSADASYTDVLWSSSNPRVASVSRNGTITGKAKGRVTITATSTGLDSSGKTLSASVTVKVVAKKSHAKVRKVVASVPASLSPGAVAFITASYRSASATGVAVRFSSSNSGVVDVDAAGRIVAVSAGTATITVTAGTTSKSYRIVIG